MSPLKTRSTFAALGSSGASSFPPPSSELLCLFLLALRPCAAAAAAAEWRVPSAAAEGAVAPTECSGGCRLCAADCDLRSATAARAASAACGCGLPLRGMLNQPLSGAACR